MSAKLTTPWGEASLIERVTLPQRAGEKRFSSVVELLEGSRGERLVRFAYSTDGVLEAIESPGPRFRMAVQWHPETHVERTLFGAFVTAAGASR